MNKIRSAAVLAAVGWISAAMAHAQSGWSPARLLSDPAHTGDIKEPKLAAAREGGFHAMYRHLGNGVQVQYRRFQNGVVLPPVEVHRLGFLAGGEICEAGDGAIHLVWENWDDANEQIWWARSVNGGSSFAFKQQVSSYGNNPNGQGKNPMVIPFGGANAPDVLALSWGAPPTDALYYNRYNGVHWLGHTPVGQSTANSYAAWGCARDPRDGSVYRCYGIQVGGVWQIAYRRFNGSTWDPQVVVSQHTNDFASRPAIAINAAGQIMIVWDKDSAVWYRVRDPLVGWGVQTRLDDGYIPSITAIPGRPEFYLAHPYPRDTWNHIVGRKWANNTWGPRTRIMNGIGDDYSPNCDVTADEQGNLYCAWEYWATGAPRAWFSVLSNQAPARLISPTNFQGVLAPATIVLEAGSTDPGATLTHVNFYDGTNSVGQRTTAPFRLTLPNLGPGNYSFTAVSSNNLGAFGTSAPVKVVVVAGTATTLVSAGAGWRYFTNGTDLGTAWRGVTYNDNAWPSGPAQLGFGDGDEATLLNSNRLRITTYFRRAFEIPFARAVKALTVRILRDDGAAVYLNGVELLRSNLPENADYQTSAIGAVGGADETNWLTYVVNPAALAPGSNVLAVEVHQWGTNSSDLSFDLELSGLRAHPSPPRVTIATPAPHQGFLAPASFSLTAALEDDDGDGQRVEFFADGALLLNDTMPPFALARDNVPAGEYAFTVRGYDALGLASGEIHTTVPVVAGNAATLLSPGSLWKYRDNGLDPGPSWTSIGFADGGWPEGRAQLGYGDGDEVTTVSYGTNASAKHMTTWFRRTFQARGVRDIRGLTLRLLRDDGAVVHLNGREVWRSNMPDGPVTPETAALAAIGGLDESLWVTGHIDPAFLNEGANVLAVEVHQSVGTSTDLSFDAELSALTSDSPSLRAVALSGGAQLSWPASTRGYWVEGTTSLTPPVAWRAVTNSPEMLAGQNVVGISNAPGPSQFYRLRRD